MRPSLAASKSWRHTTYSVCSVYRVWPRGNRTLSIYTVLFSVGAGILLLLVAGAGPRGKFKRWGLQGGESGEETERSIVGISICALVNRTTSVRTLPTI